MEILDQTRFVPAFTRGMDKAGREHLVLVVKSAFDFPDTGERPPIAEDQRPLVMAAEFTGAPGFSAPLWETDFAFRKARCDVVVNGSAHAPRGAAGAGDAGRHPSGGLVQDAGCDRRAGMARDGAGGHRDRAASLHEDAVFLRYRLWRAGPGRSGRSRARGLSAESGGAGLGAGEKPVASVGPAPAQHAGTGRGRDLALWQLPAHGAGARRAGLRLAGLGLAREKAFLYNGLDAEGLDLPLMIGMALSAARKGYAGGDPVLIEARSEDGACGAAVFRAEAGCIRAAR